MVKTKNAKEIAQQFIKILSENKRSERYFAGDIEWLKNRINIWEKNYIRIGLVGVTSSGKSTLLNAILGDDLLPTAVRPSSGTLITCSQGKRTEAVVYFENGSSIKLDASNLKEQLSKYGDEAYNEKNKYKVKIIHVKSPNFLFPENIQIIDSPGLDAYGLERHEKMTMEMLLPTIDMSMYVVTLKANSDMITGDILHTINDHQKPLFIVQNMLDSVEAKIGKDGIILKTAEDVALEYKDRMKRILKDVDNKLLKIVDIVQLSAKMAVDGRMMNDKQKVKKSNLHELINQVEYREKLLRPKIHLERISQIVNHMDSLVNREAIIIEEKKTLEQSIRDEESEISAYLNEKNKLTDSLEETKELLVKMVKKLRRITNQTIREMKQLPEKNFQEGEALVNRVRDQFNKIEESFIKHMRSLNAAIAKLFKMLNMKMEDYEFDDHIKPIHQNKTPKIKKKIIEQTFSRAKSGLGNKVARFFGDVFNTDWGYERVRDNVEVIDFVAMSQSLKEYERIYSSQMEGYINKLEDRLISLLEKALVEIERRQLSLQEKKSISLEKEQMKQLLIKLEKHMKVLGREGMVIRNQMQKDKEPPKVKKIKKEKKSRILMKSGTWDLYKLSNHLLHIHFHKCWNVVQERNNTAQKGIQYSLIWGWDALAITSFTKRFLNCTLTKESENRLKNNGIAMIGKSKRIILINEPCLDQRTSRRLASMLNNDNYNVYVLFNLIQSGQTQKVIGQSELLKLPKIKQMPVNCVVQSINEFKVANNILEAMFTLFPILEEASLFHIGHLLINDANPLYSMISLDLHVVETIEADILEVFASIEHKYQYLLAQPNEETFIKTYIQSFIDYKVRGI